MGRRPGREKGAGEEKEGENRQTDIFCCCFALQRAGERPIIGLRGQNSD